MMANLCDYCGESVGHILTEGGSVICDDCQRKDAIRITMEGGVIQDIQNIPDGMLVIVRDYDVEGIGDVNADRIIRDENGDECTEVDWEGGA